MKKVEAQPRHVLLYIAECMKFDREHGLYGRPEFEGISWLTTEPKTEAEIIENMYERLRALGLKVAFDMEPDEADKHAVLVVELARAKEVKRNLQ